MRSARRARSWLWVAIRAGGALLADQRRQRIEDEVAGRRIEIAGRLVGEDDARMVGGSSGNGDALLLAAR